MTPIKMISPALLTSSVPRRRERVDRAPLIDYHQSSQDPRTIQLAAEQSTIPGAIARQPGHPYGRPPQSIRTSLLPAGSDFTDDGSLAGLTNASSSGAPESVSSSQGHRSIVRSARLLAPDGNGTLWATRLPAFRDAQQDPPVLQCPFPFLHCTRHYAMENMDDWFEHSLSHFIRRVGRHTVPIVPPTSTTCCFCEMVFEDPDGLACWMERMRHVAWHHHAGHSLAHARPDFKLFRFLWENRIIDNAEYRELSRLRQQPPRSPQNIFTPPDSPTDAPSRPTAELNERHNRST